MLDKEKLVRDMEARYHNLHNLILKDYNGDPSRLEHQWWELKYWKEAIERGVYDHQSPTIQKQTDIHAAD